MTKDTLLSVAIVGSGPSGFFAAQSLLKQRPTSIHIDIFDRLPTPYGLVRGGVAPDHQSMKSVTQVFERIGRRSEVRFFGNTTLGKDISLDDLRSHYRVVILSTGAENSRQLGIAGEELPNCIAASDFVGWYNGHPDYTSLPLSLQTERVAVVGQGNVAIDVARILARNPIELAKTDIADHALDALRESSVREIFLLGRRGALQAAFTPAELRELSRLTDCELIVVGNDLPQADAPELSHATPVARRNLELLRACPAQATTSGRRISIRFCVSPLEFIARDGRLSAVRLCRNELVQRDDGQFVARATTETETLPVGLVLTSIGYRGSRIPDVPFDDTRGIIPNKEGRVTDPGCGAAIAGVYTCGWIATGPRGLIGSHKAASANLSRTILEDLRSGSLPTPVSDAKRIPELLSSRGARFVSFERWLQLDALETERGQGRGAPRRKFAQLDQLLSAAGC